jgi:hypothetical protein
VCLAALNNDLIFAVATRLPPSIRITGNRECFDRAVTILRLEGDGLPEWCQEPAGGGSFAWAAVFLGADGILRFFPAPATAPSSTLHDRIGQNYLNPN